MRLAYLFAAVFTLPATFAAAAGTLPTLKVREGGPVARANSPILPNKACRNKCTLHEDCTKNGCIPQGQNCTLTVYLGQKPSQCCQLPNARYELYYAGSGYSLNSGNPGNDFGGDNPTTTFNGNLKPCAAAQRCSDFSRGTNPDIYYSQWSFALYWRYSLKKWQCVDYLYSNNPESDRDNVPASHWNVVDKDVEVAFGYSFPSPYDD